MGSPFRVFRKNVKPLLVVFGCLLILAWVGGSSLTTMMSGPRGGEGEDPIRRASAVAASWEGGSLTNQQLDQLVVRRALVRAFLDQVERLGALPSYQAGMDPPPLRVMPLRLPENAQEGVERHVVQTKLFADAAREAGMNVDDNAIVQYLLELGRGRVTRDDMRTILDGFQSSNRQVSIDYVFDGVRDELLARNFLMSNMYAAETVTPQQRWQDWLQANDRAIVEVAALPVEKYLLDVKNPSDSELQQFYDEYKDIEAGPDLVGDMELPSPRPGFRVPRKIDVQFVQANFNDLVTKAEGEITDEEIAKFYEENKDLFIKPDTDLLEDDSALQEPPKSDAATTEEAPDAETETPKTGEPAAPAPDAGSETSETTDTDADATNNDAAPTADAPADEAAPPTPVEEPQPTPSAETPSTTEQPAETSEPASEPADSDQSNSTSAFRRPVFRQVAFLQEQETESDSPDGSAPASESASPEAPSTPPADAAASADETPADAPAAAEEPTAAPETTPPAASAPATATETEAPVANDGTDAAAPTPPAGTPPEAESATVADKPPAAEKPPQYQPLDEVRDLIRHQLAQRRAEERISTQMDEVLGELVKEFNTYFDHVLRAQSSKADRPAPPAGLADLAPLAQKYGLTAGKTGPMTWLEFRETPVGKSLEADTNSPLSSVLYGRKDKELYQPILTTNTIDGDRYIAMKTSDDPSRVPELDQIKKEVVHAWKMREAAKLALKDAEKKAAAAQKASSSLTDFFADEPAVQVAQVDPFSYYTRGDVPNGFDMQQRFRLSQPDGIVAAGPELLQRVFELKDGEVGAALNHDHSIAYVIRVVEHQDTPDELRTAYLGEANRWAGRAAMTQQHFSKALNSIVTDLAGSKGVDWKRDPDKPRTDSDTEE